ncbi:MAG: arginase family protein [Asgard group archaeon]|nr:arginase family protein [Asgard group archaeon]
MKYEKSFCGTFQVEEIDSAIDLDGVIFGVPYEDKSPYYPKGTSQAPRTIRESSQFFSGQGLSQKSIHNFHILDIGNIPITNDYEEIMDEQEKRVSEILEKKARVIVLGGDHSIALGTTKGISQFNKKGIDTLVWLDAHLDLMNNYPRGEPFTRATVLQRVIDCDYFLMEKIFFIGIRGHNFGKEEIKKLSEYNMNSLSAVECRKRRLLDEYIAKITAKTNGIYLSLDIDVLDPAFAPGVSVPEPGGITSRELFYIIQKLGEKIKCIEIVEVNPKRDLNNISSHIAARTIFEYIDSWKCSED